MAWLYSFIYIMKFLEFERGRTRLHCVENLLWTCCKADYVMNEWLWSLKSCSEHNRWYFQMRCPIHSTETANYVVKIWFSYIPPRHSTWNATEMNIPLPEFFPILRKEFKKCCVASRTACQHAQNQAHIWVREVAIIFQQSNIQNPAGKAQTSTRVSHTHNTLVQGYMTLQYSLTKHFITDIKY